MSFLLAGGVPSLFVAVVGTLALVSAARFAHAPGAGRAGPLVAWCGSVLAAAVAGAAADLAVVASRIAATPEWQAPDQLPVILVSGVGEALSPVVLGGGLAAATALLIGVGLRRAPPAGA